MSTRTKVTIACASGFWGDTPLAVEQILATKELDYIVSDYLSEVTMAILARLMKKDPQKGYVADFLTDVIEPHLQEISTRKIRLVTNAGALNPRALKAAIEAIAEKKNLSVKVVAVTGDDLLGNPALGDWVTDLSGERKATKDFLSANAYLGAPGIVAALELGADIVVTGRIVDTALVTGPAVFALKKDFSDFGFLAGASLAGHIVECGTQCSGGNFTDWSTVPDRHNVGFPVITLSSDGSFVVTKPPGTGGLVTNATVTEQLVYEIGDPRNYLLPDVACDFSQVQVKALGENKVSVTGAQGRDPGDSYKVCATVREGYKIHATAFVKGGDAKAKARDVGGKILERVTLAMEQRKLSPFSATRIETLGGGDEILLRLSAIHERPDPLEILSKEIAPASTGLAPGLTNLLGGRPQWVPRIRLVSFLVPKKSLEVKADGKDVTVPTGGALALNEGASLPPRSTPGKKKKVLLRAIAHARSGDKGNDVNIGVIAREEKFHRAIAEALSPEVVGKFFGDEFDDPSRKIVHRWELPGIGAHNFLLKNCLGGGGASSLSVDPQGKAWAQRLLELELEIPETL